MPAPDPPRPPAPAERRLLAGAYLLAGGVALALLLTLIALTPPPPATAGGAAWFKRLEAARVGLYRRAELTRNARGDYLDAQGKAQPRPSPWSVLAAIGAPDTTWRQPPRCVDAGVATGCNLPLFELPLGVALALPLAAMALGAALVARSGAPSSPGRRSRRRLAAVAAGALLAATLAAASLGAANRLPWRPPDAAALGEARIGLYRQHLYGDEARLDRYRGIERLRAIGRGGALTVEQPDGCGALGDVECNRVRFELPLTLPLIAAVIAGALAALWLATGRPRAASASGRGSRPI